MAGIVVTRLDGEIVEFHPDDVVSLFVGGGPVRIHLQSTGLIHLQEDIYQLFDSIGSYLLFKGMNETVAPVNNKLDWGRATDSLNASQD